MTNFYAALGVEPNASLQEIKAAYRRLAKTCHPDKVQGKEAQFILIQEAYATLSEPDKRLAYDDSVAEEAPVPRFTKDNLRFYLPSDPMQYDHYQYINVLFYLQGDERLTSGQKIVDVRGLYAKLHYLDGLLYPEECYLENTLSKLDKETEARKNKIVLNLNKILACIYVLCENSDKKKLYDFSIGVDQSEEMRRVGVLIGGVERLKQYINKNINMDATSGILVLQKANLLTPDNFSQLIQEGYHTSILSDILTQLADNELLTQDNFNVLMQYKKYALGIWRGLRNLHYHKILNQKHFDTVIRSGKNVEKVAYMLEELHLLGILNEKNLHTAVHKIAHTEVWRDLDDMISIGYITRAHSKALHWSGPKELKELNEQLDNMLAHGLFLLSCDTNQGVRTMVLALDLKQDLKEFFEKTPQQQLRDKEQFKHSFITKLHSKDKYMTVHRDFWKVIVANVVIAFTGLGLLAIGLNLAINGRCFFAQTKREQFIDTMEHSAWITSSA